ncbi:hypothetical protein KKG90_09150 [Candidatus Bipolaricaulota bacterium]|nr:hypothetical protein [Candidatus Bipolaricaulota bacterium]
MRRTQTANSRQLAVGGLLALAILAMGILPTLAATITVNPGEDIQTAINNAAAGDIIQLAAGTHNVAATIDVNKSVTIAGIGAATVQGTNSGARNVFKISASDVTLRDLDITLTSTYALAPTELEDSLIIVLANAGLSGVVISGNALHWPAQAGAMSGWGGRAITIGSSGSTDITITKNTVFNTRNGIVLHYGNIGVVSDNLVYNTKGGIMQYTSSQADADNRTMTGNTWGTVHNEWDIVWNSANYDPDYVASVLGVSIGNDEGYVVDRRDAAGGHAVGNRSHIFLNPAGATAVHEAKGNMNDPFATFALGVEAVIADGDIYVDVGTYQEQVVIGKNLEILGSGLGTIIQSPDTLTQYFMTGSSKNYPIIYVHDADDVAIRDLVVDGLGKGNAHYRFIGIAFFNAGGAVDGVEIRGIENTPFSGAQHGVAIYAYNTDNVARTLHITDTIIHDFQKNAMALSGTGLTVDVSGNNVVLGEGQTATIAQNGIQVGYGAGGVVSNNTVSSVWYTGPNWGSSGILILDAADGIQILDNTLDACQFGIYLDSASAIVQGNDISGSRYGMILYGSDSTVSGNDVVDSDYGVYYSASPLDEFTLNVFSGNYVGLYMDGAESEIHFNSIAGNDYGVYNTGSLLDATLNWWGSAGGPWFDLDFDDVPEYGGSGDIVYGNVIFSPWLGIDPDGDPGTVGVQLISPMLFIVDDVGPAPALGYLGAAIDAANTLPGIDSIEVRHGTYDASEPITDGVNIYSEVGSAAHTFLNGPISINVSNVLLGRMRQGFTINGDITVGAGINASDIHINWNDLLGVVTNNGSGTLDAIFNYWGEDGPDTVGNVAVYPLLPIPSDTIISYMDEHGLSALDAIDFAVLLDLYLSERNALAAVELMNVFGFSAEEAATLVEEYGALAVDRALAFCGGDYDDFLALLVGYASGGGGGGSFLGGGAGGSTGTAGFCVGCSIPLQLELVHPITGEPITDAVVSYSVCRTLPDGTAEIVALGVMHYDGDLGAYLFDVDTSGFEPGIYDIYLGTDDGRSRHFQVNVLLIGV